MYHATAGRAAANINQIYRKDVIQSLVAPDECLSTLLAMAVLRGNELGCAAISDRPLLAAFPQLAGRLPWVGLGQFPTPVHSLSQASSDAVRPPANVHIKRDDLSAPLYGGNKVRTLEPLLAEALHQGAERVYSTGSYGSNHALATSIHAPRLGLVPGALLSPQPATRTAALNLASLYLEDCDVRILRHWSLIPYAMFRTQREPGAWVMPPGGATPRGALGYVSAALELAEQVRDKQLPEPKRIVLAVGSTCTSAGLLVGLALARRMGLAFLKGVPLVHAVRVTPWPVTSPLRIAHLAWRAAGFLNQLGVSHRFTFAELRSGLVVDPDYLGAGYGEVSSSGQSAMERFGSFGRLALDTTYSAKAAAGLLRFADQNTEESLFWSTKSSAPLPNQDPIERALPRCSDTTAEWLAKFVG